MAAHGVKGAVVEVNDADIRSSIREVRKNMLRDGVTIEMLRSIQADLASQLSKMLVDIARHGSAMSSTGEFYDRQKFDDDLVACAIYDHVANGTPIAITDNIGPKSGDMVN